LPDNASYHATNCDDIGGNHGSICALRLAFGRLAAEPGLVTWASPRNPDVRMVPVPGCATGQAALASIGHGGPGCRALPFRSRPPGAAVSICRHPHICRNAMTAGVLALALGACSSSQHSAKPVVTSAPASPAASATTSTAAPATPTTSTTAATPKQTLPPLNFQTLPVPSHYTCPAGLYFLSPANQAVGFCVPYAYLVGGTASDPSNNTACPAGSFMPMGPVLCANQTGIVTPVPPGPDTCSTPGGPCPSSKLPLSPRASVISWSAIEFPTGKCPAGYYFGETNGVATCVPYDYLPGGTPANPDNNTACPAGSGLKPAKLTRTLCTQDAEPYDIVAPVPATSQ
jgi:hypothetical protein